MGRSDCTSGAMTTAFQQAAVVSTRRKYLPFDGSIDKQSTSSLNAFRLRMTPSLIKSETRASLMDGTTLPKSESNAGDDTGAASAARVSEALQEVSEKLGTEVSGETFHERLEQAEREKMGFTKTGESPDVGIELSEWQDLSEDFWTPEQSAAYALLDEADDKASATATLGQYETGVLRPPIFGADGITYDATIEGNPRKVNAQDVGSKLDAVKRRRRRLAAERGEDTIRVLNPHTEYFKDANGPVSTVLHDVARNYSMNVMELSVSTARIIDMREELLSSSGCALTAAAGAVIREETKVPLVHRPFAAMQAAFLRSDNPPCPRCSKPTPARDLASPKSVCGNCHREIYLQLDRAGDGDVDLSVRKWKSEEELLAESRAAQDARIVTTALLRERSNTQLGVDAPTESTTDTSGNGAATSSASGIKTRPMSGGTGLGRSGDSDNTAPPGGMSNSRGDDWSVRASDRSLRTINPIRNLVQNIDVKPNPEKELIKLSVGDPTVYGNLAVSQRVLDRFCEIVQGGSATGYSMSMGSEEARAAVANRYSSVTAPLTAEDVLLTSGTSGALEVALGAIANEGDNILLPRPGFPLFRTIAEGYGIECRYYRVNADKNWEIELGDLAELSDNRTAAIVVNNPSNPCGSVFSATHIEDLLAAASALKLPIVADEVYADMVFSGSEYTSIAIMSEDVPVLSVGSISKQCVVPGWRVGWILVHDRNGLFESGGVRKGMRQLTTRMLVPNTPVQQLLPTMLQLGTKDPTFRDIMGELEMNAEFTVKSLANAKGLRVIEPQGSMYVMVEIDVGLLGFKDDMEFTETLLAEEAVFVLPGECFQAPNFVRIVFAAPREVLSDAFYRIRAFCSRHSGGM